MFKCLIFEQLRSSFSKAFSRNKKERLGSLSLSDVEDGKHETVHESEFSAPTSPMVYSKQHHHHINIGSLNTSEAEDDEIGYELYYFEITHKRVNRVNEK